MAGHHSAAQVVRQTRVCSRRGRVYCGVALKSGSRTGNAHTGCGLKTSGEVSLRLRAVPAPYLRQARAGPHWRRRIPGPPPFGPEPANLQRSPHPTVRTPAPTPGIPLQGPRPRRESRTAEDRQWSCSPCTLCSDRSYSHPADSPLRREVHVSGDRGQGGGSGHALAQPEAALRSVAGDA